MKIFGSTFKILVLVLLVVAVSACTKEKEDRGVKNRPTPKTDTSTTQGQPALQRDKPDKNRSKRVAMKKGDTVKDSNSLAARNESVNNNNPSVLKVRNARKFKGARAATENQVPAANGNVDQRDVISSDLPPDLLQGSKGSITGAVVTNIGEFHSMDMMGTPLAAIELPEESHVENCNAVVTYPVTDSFTGGRTKNFFFYTTGRADGVMAYMKSLIECQNKKLRIASKALAVNVVKPAVKIWKSGKGNLNSPSAEVAFNVMNGGKEVKFRLAGPLTSRWGMSENFSNLHQVDSDKSAYKFQGKLFCLNQNSDCTNTLVMVEQLVNGKVCKRIYFMRRFGNAVFSLDDIQRAKGKVSTGYYRDQFINYLNTAPQIGVPSTAAIRRASDILKVSYSVTEVAFGPSSFEFALQDGQDYASQMFALRGPLKYLDGFGQFLNLDFGIRFDSIENIDALRSYLRRPMSGDIGYGIDQIYLVKNLGDGNLSVEIQFLDLNSSPLRMDISDRIMDPVVPLEPWALLKAH